MYELAADLTLIVHFAFIIFVVFGALLFFVSTKIIYVHVPALDRKSTRLNSSHALISYAVFCLKKKNAYLQV